MLLALGAHCPHPQPALRPTAEPSSAAYCTQPPSPPAAAVASGNIDGAAQQIAQAINSGNSDVVAAATTLCATAGTTAQFTQAVSLAVTKYGASADAAAAALSTVSGQEGAALDSCTGLSGATSAAA